MRYIVEEYGLPVEQLDLSPQPVGIAMKPAEIGRVSATLTTLKPNPPFSEWKWMDSDCFCFKLGSCTMLQEFMSNLTFWHKPVACTNVYEWINSVSISTHSCDRRHTRLKKKILFTQDVSHQFSLISAGYRSHGTRNSNSRYEISLVTLEPAAGLFHISKHSDV